ncbi:MULTISPECIES: glutathione-disulfide reductase [unclassified Paracoccus (in: a-proteobacteria)]|uniref:glutathione-disulfide reductase n=1 Tax=unclassified Paracoccus (in: a-proteobacteria) TaxID=2688777 RepID=UPI0012B344F5|nr:MULTISPECIES: glutathione-disulfide reductase [unclassified Paracoccus (in: a-proteobacteria)]UXU74228.1 glutathione-disulfide reductase [Paracoccus sp. SMMA_5]UXU80119.1 glutathione-disulfide reductase [Paracoccus sp. SMMA_5_TC]
MKLDYDLFVIGGGSGGVRAARIAASEYGAHVGLAEESRMGGTCVIRGCVPKKLMIFASQAGAQAAEARGYGWQGADAGRFDWKLFRQKLDSELTRLEGAYTGGLTAAGVEIHKLRARVADAHTVELADGQRLTAKHILIAVGGRPQRPGIPGEELGLISDDLFLLDQLPGRVLVVGGGFIACEFATILQGLGSRTVLSYRGDAVLRGFDQEMRRHATEQLRMIGVDLRLGSSPARLEAEGASRRVTFKDGSSELFDAVIFATGRAPYTRGLGLEEAGVQLGDKGEIVVDGWSQSSVPSIYAVGDVTDRVNLTPVAIREGHSFADTVFGARPRQVDHDLVASAVYLRPHELATIGLTEEQAEARGPADVYVASFRPMRSLFAGSDARAVMKLIVDAETDKVLGCHIFGPEAGEMIQLVAVPMGMGATKAQFDAAMAVHPTLAEELVTMRKPARRIGAAK